MRIALIGATGFIGSAIRQEALSRGHHVTAIVSNPARLPAAQGLEVQAQMPWILSNCERFSVGTTS